MFLAAEGAADGWCDSGSHGIDLGRVISDEERAVSRIESIVSTIRIVTNGKGQVYVLLLEPAGYLYGPS